MRSLAVLGLLLAAGCAGGAPASPLAVDREMRMLLRPFETDNAVVCDELLIEISANFNDMVTRPAVNVLDANQRTSREEGDGHVEYGWVNLGTGIMDYFKFMVVGTERYPLELNEFVALQSARLRILESGALTFRITARGQVTVDRGGERRDMQEFRIENGQVVDS